MLVVLGRNWIYLDPSIKPLDLSKNGTSCAEIQTHMLRDMPRTFEEKPIMQIKGMHDWQICKVRWYLWVMYSKDNRAALEFRCKVVPPVQNILFHKMQWQILSYHPHTRNLDMSHSEWISTSLCYKLLLLLPLVYKKKTKKPTLNGELTAKQRLTL